MRRAPLEMPQPSKTGFARLKGLRRPNPLCSVPAGHLPDRRNKVGVSPSSLGFHEYKRFRLNKLARCFTGQDAVHIHAKIQLADRRACGKVELL